MNSLEIVQSGIQNSSSFRVTLQDYSKVTFKSEHPAHQFFIFHPESNTISSNVYFTDQGRQHKHIAISGNDIRDIVILRTKEGQLEEVAKDKGQMTILVAVFFLVGFFALGFKEKMGFVLAIITFLVLVFYLIPKSKT